MTDRNVQQSEQWKQQQLLAIALLLLFQVFNTSVTAFHHNQSPVTVKSTTIQPRRNYGFTSTTTGTCFVQQKSSISPSSSRYVTSFDRSTSKVTSSLEQHWHNIVTTLDLQKDKVTTDKQKCTNKEHRRQVEETIDSDVATATKAPTFGRLVTFDKSSLLSRVAVSIDNTITTISAQLLVYHLIVYQSTRAVLQSGTDILQSFAKHYWWTFPLVLCFAPVLTHTICQQPITTPDFWKMVNLQYILQHSPDAAMVIQCFIGSNIAYFIAGSFLLYRFPGGTVLKRGLGLWTISAGLISTIFHTVQAIGDCNIAEALCYIDHGIAGAAVLYFWKTCGPPPMTIKFWSVSIAGLAALSLPLQPGYAWLHSTWHFLSAYSAILWAMEGKLQRQQCLLNRIRSSRKLL